MERELVVYLNGSASLKSPEAGGDNLGACAVRYELVEPAGPEMPIYVTA